VKRLLITLVLVALTAALLVGCGGPSADLYVLQRSGSIPGAKLTMIVGDGGTVRCNGDDKQPGPARKTVNLKPGKYAILRYNVRTEFGTVAFSDSSRGQPPVFFKLATLTRDLAKHVCGLPR